MNREIEFRGYNPKNRKWLYGYYLVNRGKHYIVRDGIQPPSATPEDFEVEPKSIGQYTGLEDRNGKRIYIGDFVRFKYKKVKPDWSYDAPITIKGKVAEDIFGHQAIFETNSRYHIENATHGEVIGNVHNNPELVKTTEQ